MWPRSTLLNTRSLVHFFRQARTDVLKRAAELLGVGRLRLKVHRASILDVLAASVARLLLWTDPKRLPVIGDASGAWDLYLRTWRPDKPHPRTWAGLYSRAVSEFLP